jgi:hypothetical protein
MLNFKNWIKYIIQATIICMMSSSSIAASFLETEQPIMAIEDEYRMADAWGTCAAAYEVMALLQAEASPAVSKSWSDKANGADIALFVAYFLAMDTNVSDDYSARIKMGQLLSKSIPETKLTSMLAKGEATEYSDEWANQLANTIKLCQSNIEEQQILIDTWRQLYASGVLE